MSDLGDNQSIQSVERALVLLKHLSNSPYGLSIKDLGKKTGLPSSTVHRILASLINQNFVVRDEGRHLYFTGPAVWELQGGDLHAEIQKFSDADYFLTRLRDELGHTLHLAVLDYRRLDVVTIKKKEGTGFLRVVRSDDDEDLAYCSATGRILLSELSEADLDRYFSTHAITQCTPHTVTDILSLRKIIETVRSQKWAIESNEFYDGVTCVGVPVRNSKGELIAALSVSAPTNSNFLSVSSLLPVLNKAAEDIGDSYDKNSDGTAIRTEGM